LIDEDSLGIFLVGGFEMYHLLSFIRNHDFMAKSGRTRKWKWTSWASSSSWMRLVIKKHFQLIRVLYPNKLEVFIGSAKKVCRFGEPFSNQRSERLSFFSS